MNRAYFAGILTGAVCCLAGYLMGHSSPVMADAAGGGSSGMILTTPNTSDAQIGSLVYVLKSEPPEDATLVCYKNTGKGDLELVSARRVAWDFKVWNLGAGGESKEKKPTSPEELKKAYEESIKNKPK